MDVEKAVRGLLDEDAFYDRNDNRSPHREHLVRPVGMLIRGSSEEILAFSRSVSTAGIALITKGEIAEGSTAILTVETLKGEPVKLLAQCRWCRPYGRNWRISGWAFVNIHR
jgi:hypothetical protein